MASVSLAVDSPGETTRDPLGDATAEVAGEVAGEAATGEATGVGTVASGGDKCGVKVRSGGGDGGGGVLGCFSNSGVLMPLPATMAARSAICSERRRDAWSNSYTAAAGGT